MICPKCNTEMEKGYIQSNGEIIYTVKATKLPLPIPKKSDIKLTHNVIAPATCDASHCPVCRRIFVAY